MKGKIKLKQKKLYIQIRNNITYIFVTDSQHEVFSFEINLGNSWPKNKIAKNE